jgi:hypothetical protein
MKEKTLKRLDIETWKYINHMCKTCNFYNEEENCKKNRRVQECAKKGLKNKN